MNNTEKALFYLIQTGLGFTPDGVFPKDVDWMRLFDLSEEQGVTAIALDGFQGFQVSGGFKSSTRVPKVPMVWGCHAN